MPPVLASTTLPATKPAHGERGERPGIPDRNGNRTAGEPPGRENEGEEARFRLLLDAASDPCIELDSDGVVAFANQALLAAVAQGTRALEGMPFYEIVMPYDHAAVQAWIRRSLDAAGPGVRDPATPFTLRALDGTELPVQATATPRLEHGRVTGIRAILVDLSEQERAAREQQETGELFQLLGQHAPWGVFVTDPIGRLRFANRHWRTLADVLHIPAPRGVWWQMVHPADRDRVLAQWNAAMGGVHEFASEHRVNIPGPEPRWVRTRIAQSWTPEGARGACVGISEDITLQRQADDVLRKAHEQLEDLVRSRTEELREANRELTSLVYAMTHDLKTPLRGINRLADWLAEDHAAALPTEGRSLIAKIQTRVRQLHTLIDGMLAYSRIGRNTDPEQLVDLNGVVAEVARLLDPPPGFSIVIPERLPTVTGVPHQLHQTIQNLVDNAIKFMDKPRGRIQITCRRVGGAWEFTFSDNGPGIAPRYHEKVFQLFQRLENSPDQPGAGIGLALVKRIIETRGGRIHLASEEGHGTAFQFTWPDNPRHPSRA